MAEIESAQTLNAVSRDKTSASVRQAATQEKGPGNEVGQADVPKNFKPICSSTIKKKIVSVRQP